MKKHELNLGEKITYFLVVALFFCLVFSLIQTIFLENRFGISWSVLFCIMAGIFGNGGVSLFTVPLRYRRQEEMQFRHFNSYLIKGGMLSIGTYFYYYAVFSYKKKDGPHFAESIDSVAPRKLKHYKEGARYQVWISNQSGKCCICRRNVALFGLLYLLIAVAFLLISFGVYTFTV